jgi:hypothetical protein
MEEEVETEEVSLVSGSVMGTTADTEMDVDDNRVHYTGTVQKISPNVVVAETAPESSAPQNFGQVDPVLPGVDILNGTEDTLARSYKCNTDFNFIRGVKYKHIDLLDENGEFLKEGIKHCKKTCDSAADKCNGFFYLLSSDNGAFCGLDGRKLHEGTFITFGCQIRE